MQQRCWNKEVSEQAPSVQEVLEQAQSVQEVLEQALSVQEVLEQGGVGTSPECPSSPLGCCIATPEAVENTPSSL